MKKMISPEAIELLMLYNWPGNIRQLENLIERLVVTTSTEVIDQSQLPSYFLTCNEDIKRNNNQPVSVNSIVPLKKAVESLEKQLLEKTFAITNSCSRAAQLWKWMPHISRKANKYQMKYTK
jgi:transcriptional regulator with PAS, ATPase and Fis domain